MMLSLPPSSVTPLPSLRGEDTISAIFVLPPNGDSHRHRSAGGWTRREDDEVRRSDDGSVEESGDAEMMEIVDFHVVADDGDDGGKQRDENRPNEGEGKSSAHAANKIRGGGGRIERGAVAPVPSNERSSFPPHDDNDSEEHACAFARQGDPAVPPTPLLPEFPCSPIAGGILRPPLDHSYG